MGKRMAGVLSMISVVKRLCRDRRGNALVIAGAALPLLVGSAGLATDTIQWALWKRQLQRAADSAAMAGVYAKVSGQTLDDCSNVPDATYDKPIAYDVKQNNFVGIATACTAQNSPSSGPYSSDPHAVRVTVSVQKALSFSSMFMSSPPTISATATATIIPGGEYCVVSLENTATTGITATGSATVNMGCGMITNSTSMSAAIATGSSTVTASPIAAVGGISASNNWGAGTTLQPFTMAQEDPFANVNPPTPTNCQKFSDWVGNTNKPGGVVNLATPGSPVTAGGTYCLKESGGTLDIQADVTLPKGTYVLDATSLKMTSTNASLKCHECTFILTSSTASTNPGTIGTVSLQGGKLDLTAASDGPYKGLMIYQDRRAPYSSNITNLINGNSSSSLLGALYFPNQKMTFNGTSGMTTECLQLVARIVGFSGNNSISNNCPPASGANAFKGKKIRLVA
jgi:Flp pilus assembly protein TadG